MNCLSSPAKVRRKGNAKEVNRTRPPNVAKQGKVPFYAIANNPPYASPFLYSHDDATESDAGHPESEEETETNPYPLENKFVDEEDRAR